MSKKSPFDVLEQQFIEAGLAAILEHSKSKLYAKVNREDNFCLAVWWLAEAAILDMVDDKNPLHVVWFNKKFSKKHPPNSGSGSPEFDKLLRKICQQAYQKLRP